MRRGTNECAHVRGLLPRCARLPPHPWQRDLAALVCDTGWPDALDVPTGLGKTSVLDIAAYAFACDQLAHARRMFFVVDRRLVVDQAYEHAQKLAAALSARTGAAAGWVADRLTAATSPAQPVDEPLTVTKLRGGITWSARWISRPDQPAIVTGTVDQIGSRMLFRGYGTSVYARPIDAALTFADSLVFLDEAHLSRPFQQTVSRIDTLEQHASAPVRPVRFVSMSATICSTAQSVFRLDPHTNTTALAAQVLTARKPALAEHPLAKSGMDPADRAAWHRAHTLSGYPDSLRHEALSATLAARYLTATGAAPDHADLVIHLVAAHHGRTRPLMDPVTDPNPREVTIDLDGHHLTASTADIVDWTAPARFTRLQRRYGWYRLALLETIVRLAEMTCSAEGS